MKKYKCTENDNYIKVYHEDNEIDELLIGTIGNTKSGEVVIGFNDLEKCLNENGYDVKQKK
jgi:hypothetical protein